MVDIKRLETICTLPSSSLVAQTQGLMTVRVPRVVHCRPPWGSSLQCSARRSDRNFAVRGLEYAAAWRTSASKGRPADSALRRSSRTLKSSSRESMPRSRMDSATSALRSASVGLVPSRDCDWRATKIRDLPEHPSETRKRPPNRFALRVGSADVGGNHHPELGVECRGNGPALRRRALLRTEHIFFVSQPGE